MLVRNRVRMRGTTLVEVLAAAAILGGAATSLLLAHARSLDRLHTCNLQRVAARAARELIAEWRLADTDLATTAGGQVEGARDWSWQRSSEPMRINDEIAARRVVLELMYARQEPGAAPWTTRFEWLVRHAENERKN